MTGFKRYLSSILFLGLIVVITQGCLGKNETVELMPGPGTPVDCEEMLLMSTRSIPDDDFSQALDRSYYGTGFGTCWKPLMRSALKENRRIPKRHLAKAIHVFNRNDSKAEFSSAVDMYFKEIINGNGSYQKNEKKLMVQYLSFVINDAQSKRDKRLAKAKIVCSRLDPDLYSKVFR
ncbi:MAG: hypothetical protein GY699_02775 [Desulfobacteraceae bacterium]|nr:hypothetical protein [Desulfobacteraceae bacterium]